MSLLDFARNIYRQEMVSGGKDRQDLFPWTPIRVDMGEVELLRVTYASPRLLAVQVFVTTDVNADTDPTYMPRVFLEVGTDRGTLKYSTYVTPCVTYRPNTPGYNAGGVDKVMYPPVQLIPGKASNDPGSSFIDIACAIPVPPIEVPAQSLRVTVRAPQVVDGAEGLEIYAAAVCAPVQPDVSEIYLSKMAAILNRLGGRR